MSAEDVARQLFSTIAEAASMPEAERARLAEETWAEDAVYREDPRLIGAAVHRGREAIVRCWLGYAEIFEQPSFEITRVETHGDRVAFSAMFRGRVGDMPVEHEWGYVLEARDGLVQSLDAYFDPAQARAALR